MDMDMHMDMDMDMGMAYNEAGRAGDTPRRADRTLRGVRSILTVTRARSASTPAEAV